MVKNKKNYFSFFGILLASVSTKIHSQCSSIASMINKNMPKIAKLLHAKQLKPIKQYSSNNI